MPKFAEIEDVSYTGPATLLADEGAEIPVAAKLWGDHDARHESWRGVLETGEPFRGTFSDPIQLRLPDGTEMIVDEMSGSTSQPEQVEVRGLGPLAQS